MKKSKYDVVIIGGGTSGCACAYTCAKKNLKTLLVEKNNYLGGLMTGGLVIPVMKSSLNNLNTSYYKALVKHAKKYSAQITYKDGNDGWFNPELLKIVLDDLLKLKNLDILFESELKEVNVKNNKINSIEISSNMLSIPIVSKYYVDCSGFGILAKLSGCEFLNDNNQKQKNSLRFILSNVNIEKFCKFIKSIDSNEDITNTYRIDSDNKEIFHFTTASVDDGTDKWAMSSILKKGLKDTLKKSDLSYFQVFSVAGSTNQVAFNCPRTDNYDDIYKSSLELIKARQAIYRLYRFAKTYFQGFENAEITNIAQITGVREQKRVKCKYLYTKSDLVSGKKFKNTVLCANYPIDIHSNNKTAVKKQNIKYELPIESLMSFDIDNLFVAGKILGSDFTAQSALRVQKSCMSMGEGVAKYISKLLSDTKVVKDII